MSRTFLTRSLLIFYFFWTLAILIPPNLGVTKYPFLRARLGTILHHSQDNTPQKSLAFHNYCFYPKPQAKAKVIIERTDSGDCANWYGQVILPEGYWASEREKFWWSKDQFISDSRSSSLLF